MLLVGRQSVVERRGRRGGELRCRGFHHGKDRPVPVESVVELNVPLAPVQIRRNQRVDIGIDFKMTGRIEAGRDRKSESDQDS